MFIDFIGLIAAAAAGAAQVFTTQVIQCTFLKSILQPLMSLLFGNLTQEFVRFGTIAAMAQQGEPGFAELVPAAAESFKKAAANNASYLVYIGERV